ncbi:hypothetical protein [Romboutsia hominis]|uniref:Uncharacterized protein n=1 Tax=Romboutsia hominis TaxID=1507512 RepID=A0A2P2BSJ8_9FIRM|nr:hypothetical protein [Romboutsia hominis]CEI73365.1 Hypothetical protein FRIFI_1834 [Romboutsia hominis]
MIIKKLKLENSIVLIIILLMIMSFFMSIMSQGNLIIFTEVCIIGFIFCIYLWQDEERLLYYTILFSIFSNLLGNISGALSNIPQVFLVLIIMKIISKAIIKREKIRINKSVSYIVILMMVLNTITYALNINFESSIVLYIWTMLKRYSFFFVYLYVYNLNSENNIITNLDKTVKTIVIIQFFLTLIQFFQGIDFDNIAGVFGEFSTGEYSIFLLIYFIILYEKKNKTKLDNMFLIFLVVHIIIYSAIAEVKLLMLLFPTIVLIEIILKKKKLKELIYIILIFGCLFLGYKFYLTLYPQNDLLDKDFLDKYLTSSYGEVTQLNRLNFVDQLQKNNVLEDDSEKLFGKGIGAVHPSDSTELLQGPYYLKYKYLRIDWFTLPYLVTESGYIGTFLFLGVYLIILIKSLLNHKRRQMRMLFLITLVSVISLIYSSSMIGSIRLTVFAWFYIGLLDKRNIKLEGKDLI